MSSQRSRWRLPSLPPLAEQKLTKTTYTRGASPAEIYQNRVTRSNTVLIPWNQWSACRYPGDGSDVYESDFIVLLEPSWYFTISEPDERLGREGLSLGDNALLIYRRRHDWEEYGPPTRTHLPNGIALRAATSRISPMGGVYFARVAGTITAKGTQVSEGFNSTKLRGAGIRVFEYASTDTIRKTKLQLEALLWLCHDAESAMRDTGMTQAAVTERKSAILGSCEEAGLLDKRRMRTLRMLNEDDYTICPLCLLPISGKDFMKRSEQAEGREVHDITITEISLFHIQELRVGRLQHKIYNLGWGHHFCNVVVKDAGIIPTLQWMKSVLSNQPTVGLEIQRDSVEKAVDR